MFWTLFVIFICVCLWLIKECKRPKNYPPGPPLLPIIGTWYCIPSVPRSIHIKHWRQQYGHIIGHRLGRYNIVFITGHDEIVNGLRHPNIQARVLSEFLTIRSLDENLGFFFGYKEQWAKVRAATMRYLGQSYNEKLSILVRREIEILFKSIKSGSITNINHDFMDLPLNLICSLLIGPMLEDNRAEIQTIKHLTNLAFEEGRNLGLELFYPKLKCFIPHKWLVKSSKYTHDFFTKCVEKHKETFNPSNIRDYVDWFLLESEKEKNIGITNYFTENELSSCMLDLLQAGNQSTGHTIIFVLMYVALNPKVQVKMHDELDSIIGSERFPELKDKSNLNYIQAVINEAMRINPIAPIGVVHVVSKDICFYDYNLPEGTVVAFCHDDMFKDPEYWNEPEEFIPERFLIPENKKKLTNFGLGARSCIGEILVKNAMFLFISAFFQKYRIDLPKDHNSPSTEPIPGFTLAPRPFKLIITERQTL